MVVKGNETAIMTSDYCFSYEKYLNTSNKLKEEKEKEKDKKESDKFLGKEKKEETSKQSPNNQIIPYKNINDLKNDKLIEREIKKDLLKKFTSLYVLDFVQDDDIFEFFKSLLEGEDYYNNFDNFHVNKENKNQIARLSDFEEAYKNYEYGSIQDLDDEETFTFSKPEIKLEKKEMFKKDSKKDCLSNYIYMIIENPNNRNEAYEVGLKIMEVIPHIQQSESH